MSRRSQTTKVTGATSMMMVTLSRNGDAMPVITISITISRKGLPRDRFAAQIARKSNTPVCLMIPTMTIMPSSRKMTFQSIPSCSEKNTSAPGISPSTAITPAATSTILTLFDLLGGDEEERHHEDGQGEDTAHRSRPGGPVRIWARVAHVTCRGGIKSVLMSRSFICETSGPSILDNRDT